VIWQQQFERAVRGVVRTDCELRTGLRNDLSFAQHEFSDPLIVAAIESGHPFTQGNAAKRDLRVQIFSH
jgi:hypothetical protein